MPNKPKVPPEVKIVAVEDYLAGRKGFVQAVHEVGVGETTFKSWVVLYKTRGARGLYPATTNKQYSKETKESAVKDYLVNQLSVDAICEKYDISKHTIVRRWVKKHNNHEEFSQPNSGGAIYMIKGRKTTIDERIEIVCHCIANNKDYGKAVEKFGVSYQQIYGWVKKYEVGGIENLADRRGKRKDEDSMTEVERLQAKLKLKEAENLRLQMENELLKKLEELERGLRID